jgi:glycine cleavage system regulatory protein
MRLMRWGGSLATFSATIARRPNFGECAFANVVKEAKMTTPVVLTFIGRDRPGLVNAISEKVAASDGTWLESRLARLAGEFAGIVLVSVPEPNIVSLTAALRDLEATGLRIAVEKSSSSQMQGSLKTVKLELVGNERPGIVRDVTQALTRLGVNIEEFSSSIEGAPFSGAEMFRAMAQLSVPDGLASDDLRKALERLAAEIMVDLTVTDDA